VAFIEKEFIHLQFNILQNEKIVLMNGFFRFISSS